MDLGLLGMNAVVTGGTKGIGRAIADTLAGEGANVAICARTAEDVDAAVASMQAKGVRATGRALDVGDGPALQEWVRDVATELGGIDIVVSNVSALAIGGDEDHWNSSFRIDMLGAVRLVDAAMPSLEQSDAPCIVTISSVSGREIDFASGAYGAFKAALVHYTQGLAYHLAGKGIRANTVSPGNTYFPGGVWNQIETGEPGPVQPGARPEPHRAHGHAAGDGQRGRLHRQPASQLHHRRQPRRRRCADQGRAALTALRCPAAA